MAASPIGEEGKSLLFFFFFWVSHKLVFLLPRLVDIIIAGTDNNTFQLGYEVWQNVCIPQQ